MTGRDRAVANLAKAAARDAGIKAGIPPDVVDAMLGRRGFVVVDKPSITVALRVVIDEATSMAVTGIDRPADAREDWARDEWALRCQEDSPAWGWEGEGSQCQRPRDHEGPHYLEDRDAILQWAAKENAPE